MDSGSHPDEVGAATGDGSGGSVGDTPGNGKGGSVGNTVGVGTGVATALLT